MFPDRRPRSFLNSQVLSRLASVPLVARRPMQGNVSGRHTSPHRGSSVEFAEYRKYVPGDDLRRLDWRAYGRSDRFYVKEFEADTNLRCCLVVDTSGSINNAQIQLFLSEVQSILLAYPHLHCQLYYADAALHGPYALTPYGSLPTPIGGGGTDFRPFFTRLTQENSPWATTVAVYLTDGYGFFPSEPPPFPVLWVVTPGGRDSSQFPFGETARLLGER